jgi:hypothetical protein
MYAKNLTVGCVWQLLQAFYPIALKTPTPRIQKQIVRLYSATEIPGRIQNNQYSSKDSKCWRTFWAKKIKRFFYIHKGGTNLFNAKARLD